MEVHHLSHTDLDGYGCQLVSSLFFKKITFYNANYGKEVTAKIHEIISNITASRRQKFLYLISDLNLSPVECDLLERSIGALRKRGKSIELLLLDHHASGSECAAQYDWYKLDNNYCATTAVLAHLKATYPNHLKPAESKWLEPLVKVIDSIDLWHDQDEGFELGKVLMRMIVETKELNRYMFDKEHRSYKFSMLKKAAKRYLKPRGHILLDNAMLGMKKSALGGTPLGDTLDNITAERQIELLGKKATECTVTYKTYQGFLSYSIGNISVLANAFLLRHPEFDFFMDVSPKGLISLRSNHRCDVSELAATLFKGGGHKNASGGRIEGFKESFAYNEIREAIQTIMQGATT